STRRTRPRRARADSSLWADTITTPLDRYRSYYATSGARRNSFSQTIFLRNFLFVTDWIWWQSTSRFTDLACARVNALNWPPVSALPAAECTAVELSPRLHRRNHMSTQAIPSPDLFFDTVNAF